MGRVLTTDDLIHELNRVRRNKKVVFTNGCFDILHAGHVSYLMQARALGDILIVGLNTDSSVQKLKGHERPVQCQEDRSFILSALACVDYVVLFDEETPQRLIQKISPDVLVKGGDWSVEKIVGADFVLSKGGEVKSLPYVNGKSSSAIINKIKKL